MILDPSVPPSQSSTSTSNSTVASTTASHSNRTSPEPPTTTDDKGAMAAPGFLPAVHAFRPAMSSKSPYPLNMSTVRLFEREPAQPLTTPFANPSSPMVRVLIRRLPLNTSEESLRLMVVWSKELADVELLPIEKSEDPGFRSAMLRFRSMSGALEVKNLLDGRSNISNDAEMIVEVFSSSPGSGRRGLEPASANASSATSSAASSAPGSRQPSRFNGPFHSMDRISPTSNEPFPVHEVAEPDSSAHYMNLFSPQSPIGNYLTEQPRVSGKTLINDNLDDDDETSDLLKDPVAYAENGAPGQRRATAPQLPIGRMANLSLNTNNPPQQMGPSSLPPYASSMSAHPGPISPMNAPGHGASYPAAAGPPSYGRQHFPPVNPADQNPPCNTLYVGNLPIDTSEEELKAMFSKQRGYRRLCFRTKQNGPMCFVEFEDVSFATKTLHELYGQPLHNSVKGGIRLSFSKNPLGVRSGQASGPPPSGNMGSMNGMISPAANGFTTANGPPPGLSAPPGLGSSRMNYNLASTMSTGGNPSYNVASFPNGTSMHPWNGPTYPNGMGHGANGSLGGGMNRAHNGSGKSSSSSSNGNGSAPYLPPHMMGR